MSFNLRQAILSNVAGSDEKQVEATIQDAMQSGEEKMLPGLGVLFEVYWQHADESAKNEMISQIADGLRQ
ncbi:small acid-soluble spore protein SspI [Desertibacillus haloalkaliphilus]|uniref:small acid-soluble spore protein SspI n=1 Tax=Desertibacillus haloalkaliphilus TaxID=1328930 RepID=UPI001C27A4FF|nr:small acid-soluble spore protein SspI [Desertibacillus haloalkaliphilus]MBU8905122.1 small acid-soluble spore protein SspI [Desertibacillus haloalkaliphilus]